MVEQGVQRRAVVSNEAARGATKDLPTYWLATACCNATDNMPHHRLAQPADAAARLACGAR